MQALRMDTGRGLLVPALVLLGLSASGTAEASSGATVLYDRRETGSLAPLPDDFFLVEDASTATGRRLAIPNPYGDPAAGAGPAADLFAPLLRDANRLDGWSPLAPLVVETSQALDPTSVPRTPGESLDPRAGVQLVDVGDGSPERGARIPFRAEARSDATPFGVSHTLLVFPSRPLDGRGRYALLVTRRVRDAAGRPLAPSSFFAAALAPARAGEAPEVARVREILAPVFEVLAMPREDLALALRVSVRSTDDIARDVLAMRHRILAGPAPALLAYAVEADPTPGSDVAAVVRGTWQAPDWRPRDAALPEHARANVVRDADGLPVLQGTRPVEFVLALPRAAAAGPAPLVVHQHGNPGSPESVVASARDFLARGGFAVIGTGDVLSREVAPPLAADGTPRDAARRIELQVTQTVLALLLNGTLPDYWLETTGEQLAFLRFVETLGGLDVLPLDGPDGVPDLDLSAPLAYHGVSEGANHGQALLAHAPEIKAAALVAGGARLVEVLLHQHAGVLLAQVPLFFPGITPAEIFVGASLFQAAFDRQDGHNHLASLAAAAQRPSVLLVEGLDDSLVPNHASESAAWALGLPLLAPAARSTPLLDEVAGPLRGNLDGVASGALVQLVPTGVPGIAASPGCQALAPPSAGEGHFCAQRAAESQRLRLSFFQSALGEGPPEIAEPGAAP